MRLLLLHSSYSLSFILRLLVPIIIISISLLFALQSLCTRVLLLMGFCCLVLSCMYAVRWCPSDGGTDKPGNTRGLSFTIGCGSIPFTGLSASFTGDLILILSVVLLANNNNRKLTFGVWVPNSCRPHSDTVIIVANNRRTQTERRR